MGCAPRGFIPCLNRVVNSYNKKVLQKGGIMFSDLPILLTNSANELEKLDRDYRLDRKYKHWMLDEFRILHPVNGQ
jgi:hypothetical protein